MKTRRILISYAKLDHMLYLINYGKSSLHIMHILINMFHNKLLKGHYKYVWHVKRRFRVHRIRATVTVVLSSYGSCRFCLEAVQTLLYLLICCIFFGGCQEPHRQCRTSDDSMHGNHFL